MSRTQTKDEYNAYMRVYVLKRYHRRRVAAIERLGGKCQRCGVTDGLQFDHIDPGTKVETIGKMWSYAEERFWEEVAKCQLLCEPCHYEKTAHDAGTVPARGTHGTVSAYRYCGPPKCDECKAAKRRAPSAKRKRV